MKRKTNKAKEKDTKKAGNEGSGKELQVHRLVIYGIVVAIVVLAAVEALGTLFPGLNSQLESLVNRYGLMGTFALIFLGTTLLPFATDAYFISVAKLYQQPLELLLIAVAAGFLAGIFNYYVAVYLRKGFVSRFVDKNTQQYARQLITRFGPASLIFFSLIPLSFIEDPLTFVCGLTGMDPKQFALYWLIARILNFGSLLLLALYF